MVPPMELYARSSTLVLSLSSPLGPCAQSNDWMLHLPLSCKDLEGPLRRWPYEAPVSEHFFASTKSTSGFCNTI